jgi:hypothetical protein
VAKLIGEYLRELTELTEEDLNEVLDHQAELRAEGAPALIGEVFVLLGMVTPQEVAIALEQQARDRDATPAQERDLSKPATEWGKQD